MVRIIPFGVLLKLWASGQRDAFLLLLLGFTADVHTFCMLSIFFCDKLNHFIFMPKISIRVVCVNGKHPRTPSVSALPPPPAFLGLSAACRYRRVLYLYCFTPIVVLFGDVLFSVFCFFCFMSSVLRYSQRNRFFFFFFFLTLYNPRLSDKHRT